MKLYRIIFNEYTNSSNDTVTSDNGQYWDAEDLVITEKQIPMIIRRNFGGGIRELKYVGQFTELPKEEKKMLAHKTPQKALYHNLLGEAVRYVPQQG